MGYHRVGLGRISLTLISGYQNVFPFRVKGKINLISMGKTNMISMF